MASGGNNDNILWIKGLWNGILAWFLGFMIYLLPAFVVAFKMGFELGPKSDNPAEVSEQISKAIPLMYQNKIWLSYGLIIVISLLIFWRARKVIKKSSENQIINGLLVTVFPVFFSIFYNISSGFDLTSVLELFLFIGAGYRSGNVTFGIRYDVLYDEKKSIYADAWVPFVRVFF